MRNQVYSKDHRARRRQALAIRARRERSPSRQRLRRQIEQDGRWQNQFRDWSGPVLSLYLMLAVLGALMFVGIGWYAFLVAIGYAH